MSNVVDDDGKLRKRYKNKKSNSKITGVKFLLSFSEYVELLSSAELKSSDLGHGSVKRYFLVRKVGCETYAVGQCEFITSEEHIRRKPKLQKTEKMVESAKRNLVKAREALAALPPGEHSRRVRHGARDDIAARRLLAAVNKKTTHPSFTGKQNSQFGSFWITDGINNKKWRLENGDIPIGFRNGRV